MTFENDYQGVHKALTAGKSVEPSSNLGQEVRALASMMMNIDNGRGGMPAPKKKGGLADLFSFGKSRMLPASGQD